MDYAGFCDSFGGKNMVRIAVWLPVPLTGIFMNSVLGLDLPTSLVGGIVVGASAGAGGYVCGAFVHAAGNQFLEERNVSEKKGGIIVKCFQAAAYGLGATALASLLIVAPSPAPRSTLSNTSRAEKHQSLVSPR